jgi:hypothetical protein
MSDLNPRALKKASKGGSKSISLAAPPDFITALNLLADKMDLKKSFLIRYLVYEKLDSLDYLDLTKGH